jgi:glutamine synthetase
LNTAVAASLNDLAADLSAQKGSKAVPSTDDILTVLRKWITRTKNIRFEGNNYSKEWVIEAEKRGLPNIRSAPDAFKQLLEESHANVLVSQGILTKPELLSRYHILLEKYAKDIIIEANTLKNMVVQGVLPSVFEYRKNLADTFLTLKNVGIEAEPEKKTLVVLGTLTKELQDAADALAKKITDVAQEEHHDLQGERANKELVPLLEKVRELSDSIEEYVDDKLWPFPKYLELLF